MKRCISIVIVSVLSFILITNGANALTLGDNITIYDGLGSPTENEDGTTEPRMVNSQAWDLEGFFLNGTLLSMVGGYNFKYGLDGLTSGDIFIDIDGGVQYGSAMNKGTGYKNISVNNTFGYEYAIDLDFNNSQTFNVYKLDGESTVTVYFKDNEGSNPWEYEKVF